MLQSPRLKKFSLFSCQSVHPESSQLKEMKIGKIFLKDPLSKGNYFFDHLFFDLPFKLEFESIIPPPRKHRP